MNNTQEMSKINDRDDIQKNEILINLKQPL